MDNKKILILGNGINIHFNKDLNMNNWLEFLLDDEPTEHKPFNLNLFDGDREIVNNKMNQLLDPINIENIKWLKDKILLEIKDIELRDFSQSTEGGSIWKRHLLTELLYAINDKNIKIQSNFFYYKSLKFFKEVISKIKIKNNGVKFTSKNIEIIINELYDYAKNIISEEYLNLDFNFNVFKKILNVTFHNWIISKSIKSFKDELLKNKYNEFYDNFDHIFTLNFDTIIDNLFFQEENSWEKITHVHHQYKDDLEPFLFLNKNNFLNEWAISTLSVNYDDVKNILPLLILGENTYEDVWIKEIQVNQKKDDQSLSNFRKIINKKMISGHDVVISILGLDPEGDESILEELFLNKNHNLKEVYFYYFNNYKNYENNDIWEQSAPKRIQNILNDIAFNNKDFQVSYEKNIAIVKSGINYKTSIYSIELKNSAEMLPEIKIKKETN